jgi:hypothetical protein
MVSIPFVKLLFYKDMISEIYTVPEELQKDTSASKGRKGGPRKSYFQKLQDHVEQK